MSESFIQLSTTAVENIIRLRVENDMDNFGLRFGITGGGCSGYRYVLEFCDGPEDGDMELDVQGIPIFVAELKRDYLEGTTIDFIDEIMESGFKINNPNAKRACGCGESFDIDG